MQIDEQMYYAVFVGIKGTVVVFPVATQMDDETKAIVTDKIYRNHNVYGYYLIRANNEAEALAQYRQPKERK